MGGDEMCAQPEVELQMSAQMRDDEWERCVYGQCTLESITTRSHYGCVGPEDVHGSTGQLLIFVIASSDRSDQRTHWSKISQTSSLFTLAVESRNDEAFLLRLIVPFERGSVNAAKGKKPFAARLDACCCRTNWVHCEETVDAARRRRVRTTTAEKLVGRQENSKWGVRGKSNQCDKVKRDEQR
ncbi:hypothetical protein F2P81_024470 [Scophthalmus maximus]|uniref:Uncharacterized protein n=1 Tax=Scophthalmus maximus TaxID=52904 RepID=A0A6A4RWZ2_SCOMX|nr:hypothetical protein F2P81_024470 [Scophthalmus maximus]